MLLSTFGFVSFFAALLLRICFGGGTESEADDRQEVRKEGRKEGRGGEGWGTGAGPRKAALTVRKEAKQESR